MFGPIEYKLFFLSWLSAKIMKEHFLYHDLCGELVSDHPSLGIFAFHIFFSSGFWFEYGKLWKEIVRPEWQSMVSALATAAGQMRIWILHSYSELDFGIAGLYRDEQRGFECFAILWLWEYECEDERSHRKCDYTVGQAWKPSLGCLAHTNKIETY